MLVAWVNILESATVTVTSEADGYPAYRLYDGFFGRMWRAASSSTQTIHIDQGADPIEIDTLIVPLGHLLSGCTLSFERSPNNADWYPIVDAWVQDGSSAIRKQGLVPSGDRYARVVISGAPTPPEAGEIFISALKAFQAPLYGARGNHEAAAVRNQGLGGPPHYVMNGPARLVLTYNGKTADPAEQEAYRAWCNAWADYRRPFYAIDHDGRSGFFEFISDPEITIDAADQYLVAMQLRQVF